MAGSGLDKYNFPMLLSYNKNPFIYNYYTYTRVHKKCVCVGGEGGEERVTAHTGCDPGESVDLCLNILFTVDRRLTARCSSGCHPSLHTHY